MLPRKLKIVRVSNQNICSLNLMQVFFFPCFIIRAYKWQQRTFISESVLTFSQVSVQCLPKAAALERRYLEQHTLYGSRIKIWIHISVIIKSSLHTVGLSVCTVVWTFLLTIQEHLPKWIFLLWNTMCAYHNIAAVFKMKEHQREPKLDNRKNYNF